MQQFVAIAAAALWEWYHTTAVMMNAAFTVQHSTAAHQDRGCVQPTSAG
jgi:hypothetical protein